ncbi:MAG: mannose-6-phosphate isomerase [Ruminococcaceae bacterium]|nr:mannose-6-phosphate isomerase [Oscillospiraceae bacterium]
MAKLYPLKLAGVTKSPIWGGTRLLKDWNKTSGKETVGESWELTVRPQDMCFVANGAFSGKGFDALMETFGAELTGREMQVSEFPLLIKLIDAQDALSVQVHPDDTYAARVENDRGKTEMWYIVEADEGAELVCGLAEGVDSAAFAQAVGEKRIASALHHQPVHAGESYFIPAGLAHAIGRGILIAEIQQNCDLTYRVYDYDRRQADGSLRELHVEKALDVIRPFSKAEIDAIAFSRTGGTPSSERVLADCEYFHVEKTSLTNTPTELAARGSMRHLLCLSGEGSLVCDGETYPIQKGDSWLLPAALDSVTATGDAMLLVSWENR